MNIEHLVFDDQRVFVPGKEPEGTMYVKSSSQMAALVLLASGKLNVGSMYWDHDLGLNDTTPDAVRTILRPLGDLFHVGTSYIVTANPSGSAWLESECALFSDHVVKVPWAHDIWLVVLL